MTARNSSKLNLPCLFDWELEMAGLGHLRACGRAGAFLGEFPALQGINSNPSCRTSQTRSAPCHKHIRSRMLGETGVGERNPSGHHRRRSRADMFRNIVEEYSAKFRILRIDSRSNVRHTLRWSQTLSFDLVDINPSQYLWKERSDYQGPNLQGHLQSSLPAKVFLNVQSLPRHSPVCKNSSF